MEKLDEIVRLQKLAGIIIRENHLKQMGVSSLYEASVPNDSTIEASFEKAFGKEALDALESEEEVQNESLAGLLFTVASLLPWLMNLAGSAANAVKDSFTSYTIKDKLKMGEMKKRLQKLQDLKKKYDEENEHEKENEVVEKIKELQKAYDHEFGSKVGNWLKEKGENLHHIYVVPFKKGLDWLATKISDKRAEKSEFLKRIKEDERYRENLANVAYCVFSISVSFVFIGYDISHISAVMASSTGLAPTVIAFIIKAFKQGKKAKEIFKTAAEMI